jgi:hypothetical protein
MVVPAQAGMLHRGCSARRTRASLAGNEFCLGVFAIASMLLTHPERLSSGDALMLDCGGDEYSPRADYNFDACASLRLRYLRDRVQHLLRRPRPQPVGHADRLSV